MSGPWELYRTAEQPSDGPWMRFQQPKGAGMAHTASGSFLEGIPVVGPYIRAGAERVGAGVDALLDGTPYSQNLERRQQTFKDSVAENPKTAIAGNIAGGVVGTMPLVAAAPAAFGAGAGGLAARSGASALTGGALGGADAAVRSGGDASDTLWGTGTGAVLGGLAPSIASGVSSLASRAISPMRATPERAAQAGVLQREGVNLTAGQRTGSKGLRYAEGEIGGSRAADLMERQGEQFTSAALRRVGVNAERATPDVIDGAFRNIGQQFDDLAARNAIRPDRQMAVDLQDVVSQYGQMVPPSMRAPAVANVANDIVEAMRRGPIDGASYQALRSRLDRAARGAAADPQLSQALRGIRETLDDAMERSIAAANPADAGAWQEARRLYRNMLVVERAVTGAGENAALGLISPSQLRNAAVNQSRRGYARGQGDFSELARAGEALLKPLPQSGTAPRLRAQNIGAMIPALLGAGGGASVGGPAGFIAGAAAGAAIPRVAGALMMSRPGQAYLSNQVGARMQPGTEQVLRALLAASPPVANQQRIAR